MLYTPIFIAQIVDHSIQRFAPSFTNNVSAGQKRVKSL